MRKRFLSLLLVLVCVLTLAAAPVAAAEPDAAQSPIPTTEPAVPSPEPTAPIEPSTEPSPELTPTGPWYQAAMEFACAQGILFGDEHGDLLPMGNASRAQMAAMLVRVFGLHGREGHCVLFRCEPACLVLSGAEHRRPDEYPQRLR